MSAEHPQNVVPDADGPQETIHTNASDEMPTSRADIVLSTDETPASQVRLKMAASFVGGTSLKLEADYNRTSRIIGLSFIIVAANIVLIVLSIIFWGKSASQEIFFIAGSLLVASLGIAAGLLLSLRRKREEQAKIKDLEGTLRGLSQDSVSASKALLKGEEAENRNV